MSCMANRSIGDMGNSVLNLVEPLNEGSQGLPQALLHGMEGDLIIRPCIRTLEVGRKLAAQLSPGV
jgi:hypothetical protein